MKKYNILFKLLFSVTGLGLIISVIQMNEDLIKWAIAYLISCVLLQIAISIEEREKQLTYIRK